MPPLNAPQLPYNPARDQALQALPDDAEVRVFVVSTSSRQICPVLKPGTAAAGKVGWGDQEGQRRVEHGECLHVLAHLGSEAVIARGVTDPFQRETLILTADTRPFADFSRPYYPHTTTTP